MREGGPIVSIFVEMGWPIPSWVSLLIEEQPKVRTNNDEIANLTNIDFIQIALPLRTLTKDTQRSVIRQVLRVITKRRLSLLIGVPTGIRIRSFLPQNTVFTVFKSSRILISWIYKGSE